MHQIFGELDQCLAYTVYKPLTVNISLSRILRTTFEALFLLALSSEGWSWRYETSETSPSLVRVRKLQLLASWRTCLLNGMQNHNQHSLRYYRSNHNKLRFSTIIRFNSLFFKPNILDLSLQEINFLQFVFTNCRLPSNYEDGARHSALLKSRCLLSANLV